MKKENVGEEGDEFDQAKGNNAADDADWNCDQGNGQSAAAGGEVAEVLRRD